MLKQLFILDQLLGQNELFMGENILHHRVTVDVRFLGERMSILADRVVFVRIEGLDINL